MMKAQVIRARNKNYTKGILFIIENNLIIGSVKTLELPWKDNHPNVSCIPEGTYTCVKRYSKKFGHHFWVKDVPGRTWILIHAGNFAAGVTIDTEGCILVGLSYDDLNHDGFPDLKDSKKAKEYLLSILPDEFKLTIEWEKTSQS